MNYMGPRAADILLINDSISVEISSAFLWYLLYNDTTAIARVNTVAENNKIALDSALADVTSAHNLLTQQPLESWLCYWPSK